MNFIYGSKSIQSTLASFTALTWAWGLHLISGYEVISIADSIARMISRVTLEDVRGTGPRKLFELKSSNSIPVAASVKFGIFPWIWLWDRFKKSNWKEDFTNQLGMLSLILELDISTYDKCFCDWNHDGKWGPKWHDLRSNSWSWKGVTQLELNFNVNEFLDAEKNWRFVRLAKWISKSVPFKLLLERWRDLKEESSRLWNSTTNRVAF